MSFFRVQKKSSTSVNNSSAKNNNDINLSNKESSIIGRENEGKNKNSNKNIIDTTFVLNQINMPKLDRNYLMREIGNRDLLQEEPVKQTGFVKNFTTSLVNAGISDKIKEPSISFINKDSKINMYTNFNINRDNRVQLRPNLDYKCWYCKHKTPDDWFPISLPVKYYPSYIESLLIDNRKINQLNKLEYLVNEVIPTEAYESDKNFSDKVFYDKKFLTVKEREDYESDPKTDKTKLKIREYFDGEGIFCSFNCMLSYYLENQSKNVRYKDTPTLINLLYYYIFGKYPEKISKASSWKMLKDFGGDLSIEEFRKNFNNITYKDMNQYIKRIGPPVQELFIEESF